MEVITLIPAFNAQATIAEVVIKAKRHSGRVIVYDDGSEDLTATIAQHCGAQIVYGAKNQGKGFALAQLFAKVSDCTEDTFVVTLDADMQHNPDSIPNLIRGLRSVNADYAIGLRSNQRMHRKIANEILDKISGAKESQSGFRAYTMRAMRKIGVLSSGFGVDSEILEYLTSAGMIVAYVPVEVRYDKYSHTKNPISHFAELLEHTITRNPLAYLCIPGIVSFVGSIIGIIRVGLWWDQYHSLAIGTLLLSMIAMVLGTTSFFTGTVLYVLRKAKTI